MQIPLQHHYRDHYCDDYDCDCLGGCFFEVALNLPGFPPALVDFDGPLVHRPRLIDGGWAMKRNKIVAYAALAFNIFVACPLDDILFSSLFVTALFGFGTVQSYLLLVHVAVPLVLFWRKKPLKHLTRSV